MAALHAHDEDPRVDDELALRSQSDPTEFAELYRRYLTPVYRFCLRRVGSREAAEDVTSQVFMKALSGIGTYHPGLGSFRSWLFSIAHRSVIDSYRRQRANAPIEAAGEVADRNWQRSPEAVAERASSVAEVARLLAHLADHQRVVVELRLAGLTGPEIAATLGRSLPSVKLAQFRAFQRLRTLLDDHARETTS